MAFDSTNSTPVAGLAELWSRQMRMRPRDIVCCQQSQGKIKISGCLPVSAQRCNSQGQVAFCLSKLQMAQTRIERPLLRLPSETYLYNSVCKTLFIGLKAWGSHIASEKQIRSIILHIVARLMQLLVYTNLGCQAFPFCLDNSVSYPLYAVYLLQVHLILLVSFSFTKVDQLSA